GAALEADPLRLHERHRAHRADQPAAQTARGLDRGCRAAAQPLADRGRVDTTGAPPRENPRGAVAGSPAASARRWCGSLAPYIPDCAETSVTQSTRRTSVGAMVGDKLVPKPKSK